jgi:hypothetical protein
LIRGPATFNEENQRFFKPEQVMKEMSDIRMPKQSVQVIDFVPTVPGIHLEFLQELIEPADILVGLTLDFLTMNSLERNFERYCLMHGIPFGSRRNDG